MSENKNFGINFLKKFLDNEKYKKVIIICGLAGIVLIFISSFIGGSGSAEDKPEEVNTALTSSEAEKSLEDKLGEIISSIEGAGATKVFVTYETLNEKQYALNEKLSGQGENEYTDSEKAYVILRNKDGDEIPLEVKTIQPSVRGVLVVCKGGEDPIIKARVLNAVTKALNISSAKVCITKLSV